MPFIETEIQTKDNEIKDIPEANQAKEQETNPQTINNIEVIDPEIVTQTNN